MHGFHVCGIRRIVSALVAGTLLTAAGASAQQRLTVEGRGGVAVPAGRLADLTDVGPNMGVQIGYPMGGRLAVNLEGDLDLLQGAKLTSSTAPDMRLWRYGAGLEAKLIEPRGRNERWTVTSNLAVGATTVDSEQFLVPNTTTRRDFTHTYFTSGVGMRVGYAMNSRLSAQLGARAHWMSTSSKDTQVLRSLDPARLKAFSSAWTLPITLGLHIDV